MAGYVRTDTGNKIANGNVIDADDFDAEYNAIDAAFNASSGHTHDGTTGGGARVTELGTGGDVTVASAAMTPKTTNTTDLGSNTLRFKDAWLSGDMAIAGTTSLADTLAVTGITTLASDLNVAGSTILTGDFTLDSDVDVAGSKFLIEFATGNTTMAGTLGVTGNSTLTGSLDVGNGITSTGNFTIDNGALTPVNKFTIASASGNTVIEGSLSATNAVTAKAGITTGVTNANGDSSIGGTLVVHGVLTADAGINVDNFNIDGTTIALSTGDLILDVAGDIIADTAGNDFILKSNGTERFKYNVAGDNIIQQWVWDTQAAGGAAWVKNSTLTKTGTTVHGTFEATGNTVVGGTLEGAGIISTSDSTVSTSNTTGALTVAGGAGIVGAVNIGGAVDIDSGLTVGAASTFSNNLTVDGDLTVGGTTTTVNSTTVAIADSQFKLASTNTATDNVDIGTYGAYNNGSRVGYAGWFRDTDDSKKIKIYSDVGAEPGTTVDTSNANFTLATVAAATFEGALAGNATTATNLAATSNIALTGSVVGNVDFDGSGNVSIATTLGVDAVTLGTSTTGNYAASVAGTANEVEVTGAAGEGTAFTIGLPDDVTIGNDLTVTTDLAVTGASVLTGGLTTPGGVVLQGATQSFTVEATSTGNKLIFKYGTVSVMSLDLNGNLIVKGNITGFGTP